METDFASVWKMDFISRESVLLVSALPKCLAYAISKDCSYDKALPKHLFLPNVFVLLIDLGHFLIIEKGISILLDAG